MNISERAIAFLISKRVLLKGTTEWKVQCLNGREFDIVELLHEFASQEITVLEMAMSLDGSVDEVGKAKRILFEDSLSVFDKIQELQKLFI